jgi:outer membrane protein OmpA-like peptidoglycan-associated protein
VPIRHRSVVQSLSLAGLLAGLGCAHSFPPPQELTDARVAWARASKGPAAQVNPARLQLAREALKDAETAYGAKSEEEVRDRAYVALRRIQAAEAEAAGTLAGQRRWRALNELATLQGTHAERARAEIGAAQNRAALAEGQLVEEQARTSLAQQQAWEQRQRADSEQQGRLAAEARADQALAELSRLANVRRETRGLVITLSGQVLFASDKATLLPAATSALDNVVSALKAMPANAGRVVIEGHTDARGSRAHNRDLAERRARAVRDYLVSRGISSDLFVVEGIGPDRPVADNRSAEGRANNRRVEIILPPPAFSSTTVGTEAAPATTGGATGAPAAATGSAPGTATNSPTTRVPPPPAALPGQPPAPRPSATSPSPSSVGVPPASPRGPNQPPTPPAPTAPGSPTTDPVTP